MACKGCKSLSRIICRQYHTKDEADELAMRLAYEVIFGFIPVKAIDNGTWLDPSYRDTGHTLRMRIIWRRSKKNVQQTYPWIVSPRYI
jgi:hypothetical protein